MRNLFILRGAPSCGKSTWVKENNLEPYTLSTDEIRLMYQSPITNEIGDRIISQGNDAAVWKLLFDLLERRMANGEFIVIDATHYKSSLISRYKNLVDKYRYRVNVVNFDIPEKECLERNSKREPYKRVPEDIIKKMYACIHDDSEVKKQYKILTPNEASKILKEPLQPVMIDDSVEKVVVFGDIHGCYEPLKEYFECNPFSDNVCYIFTGDYLDRGIQNKEVLEFLLSIYEKKNVFLLEGNHEFHIRNYASKEYKPINKVKCKEYTDFFVTKLIEQLEDKIKQLNNKIAKQTIRLESLNSLIKDKEEQIFFEFEIVNPFELQKSLREEISRYKRDIETLKHYIYVLGHEKNNTLNSVNKLQEWYGKSFGENLSLNVKNLVAKILNMEEIKEESLIKSSEFLQNTIPQIEDISREEIRKLCRRFIQMSYFDFCGARFLVTHGGLPCLPDIFTPTNELIKGVGKYDDHEKIDKIFNEKAPYWAWQIHGHRNTMKVPCYDGNRTFNLEGEVEFGGNLRIVELIKTDDGWKHNIVEIKNNVFKHLEEVNEEKTDLEILREMLHSPLINVKDLNDNIISLNFNKDVFYNDKWNTLTCHARGLFVDKTCGDIVARSFSKFFNWLQHPTTKPAYLKEHFKFPLIGYRKENGFLGIISKYKGKVRFFTKSSDQGDYVNWFIGVLCDNYGIDYVGHAKYSDIYNQSLIEEDSINKVSQLEALDQMKQVLRNRLNPLLEEGYSYVFECIDKDNDPHIIKYKENKVVLLEVFKNQLKEEHVPYEELCKIATILNLKVKDSEWVFYDWESFEEWKDKFTNGITQLDCKHEGYVFEDANGFRVKFKSPFYRFWKEMRSLKERIQSGRENKKIYKSKQEIEVVKLLESVSREELQNMSIIDIRDKFYAENSTCFV